MSFDLLFTTAGAYVVPFWISMIVLPNWSITKKVMNSWLPFIPLFAFYAYYFIVSFDLESFKALAVPQLKDFVRILSQDGPAGSTLVHILLMDLFVGRWIYWEGQEKQILTTHSLILVLWLDQLGYSADRATYNNDYSQELAFQNLGISRISLNRLGSRNQLNTAFLTFKLPDEQSDRLLVK